MITFCNLSASFLEFRLQYFKLMHLFYFERCESCDEWGNLLSNFGQVMNESGIMDVAIGIAECTPDNALCGKNQGIL